MKWLLWVLWDTLEALDLKDESGKPDHGKVMGFFCFLVFTLLLIFKVIPASLGLVIVLISAAFGNLMFRTFLRSRTATSNELIEPERPRYRDISDEAQ